MNFKIDSKSYLAKAKDYRQRFLILHYTAENFKDSINSLTGTKVSAHYLIPTLNSIDSTYKKDKLICFNLVSENERAWHAGESYWKTRTQINDSSIGIEIVNLANDIEFQPYSDEQILLVIELCQDIISRYPDISPTNVLGHSDIAVGRKKDPGPTFPWYRLYQNGVGAWPDQDKVLYYIKKFNKKLPKTSEVLSKLYKYGYVNNNGEKSLIKTFQMHFRQSDYSGNMDVETASIAFALCDKYF